MMTEVRAFVGGRVCFHGRFEDRSIFVNTTTGCIVEKPSTGEPFDIIDLHGRVVAPAFLELQTNGCAGVHFTNYEDSQSYQENLEKVSRYLVTKGVGAFYATLPTVSPKVFQKVLRQLKPRTFGNGADLLGAHTEGPWLNPAKRGAHDETLMRNPMHFSMEAIYGDAETVSAIKLLTLAPELQGSLEMIELISKKYGIIVSLGHSAADLDTGVAAIKAGAKALTHVFNATNPLHHRSPGLVGLMSSSEAPYYSVIPDGIHLHPTVLAMAFRASPEKCILITDSIELAGMPDGIYPGHSQIPHSQNKEGLRATIAGTDTLIGSCISIDECVRNLKEWSGCTLPQAVRCVTENVVGLMQNTERGLIQPGRRGDFVVLDDEGNVLQTWIKGAQIYER